jgi:cytoskeletal protein CcmA (bactofilin family)
LEGSANASGTLHIVATERINGDVVVDSLIMEDGARSKGNCPMKTNAIDTE